MTLVEHNSKLCTTYCITLSHWSEQATKERIYGNLPPISDTFLVYQCLQFAGHFLRAESEVLSTLLLWSHSFPIHYRKTTYPQMLSQDSGIEIGEHSQAMRDCAVWRAVVADILASDAKP